MSIILGILAVILIIWKIVTIIRMILHPRFWLGILYNAPVIYCASMSFKYDTEAWAWGFVGLGAILFFFVRDFRRPYVVAFSIATLGLGALMLADAYFEDDVPTADVHHVEPHDVEGYTRSDGTEVSGYHRGGEDGYLRSDPDIFKENNLKF